MTGRQESDKRTDDRTKRLLEKCPKIIEDFFYSLTECAATTRGAYTEHVIAYFEYLDKEGFDYSDPRKFSEVKPNHINKYLEYIKFHRKNGEEGQLSEGTRAKKFYAIRKFYEFLLDNEYIDNSPCNRVKPPRVTDEKEIIAMTPEEVRILKENIKNGVGSHKAKAFQKHYVNRDLAIVSLGCTTGLRVGSICEINMDDIDIDNRTIIVREKGNKVRTIRIGENTAKIINDWMIDRWMMFIGFCDDALFVSGAGKRLRPEDIALMLKKYSVGIDKPITPHKMRSTCATNLYEATGDIFLVQDILGHKNIANTRRYAKMSEKRREEAVNILDKM